MKLKFEQIEKEINTENKFEIDLNLFIESYNKADIDTLSAEIKKIDLMDFSDQLGQLRSYKHIQLPKDIHSVTVEEITKKYYEIRNAINTVLDLKSKFMDYRIKWKQIETIVKNLLQDKRDELMITDEIKNLKNQELRLSEMNYRLRDLVNSLNRIELFNVRIKAFETELNETLEYLKDVKLDMSKLQSAVELALDTGELVRTYWKKNWKED